MIAAPERYPRLITHFAPLRAALLLAYAVPPETPVVIRGERGTGKSLLSQTLRLSLVTRPVLEVREGAASGWGAEWDRTLLIELPPLRDRIVDVPLLAAHFAGPGVSFSEDAIDRLQNHHWPGNIAELRDVVARAIPLRGGGCVRAQDLPPTI